MRRFALETLVLIAAAVLCAAVANAVAARERKLAWVGDYPNARVVPRPAVPRPVEDTATTPATPGEEPILQPVPPETAPATAVTTTVPSAPVTTPAEASRPPSQPSGAPASSAPRFTLADFPANPEKPSVDISPAQAEALWNLGAMFLDARRTQVYEQGHIARARAMPVWESDIDDRVVALYEEGHPQEAPIVVYCSGGACEDSHMLAQKLWGIGFNNVLVYTEGWPDWTARGLPTRRGSAP